MSCGGHGRALLYGLATLGRLGGRWCFVGRGKGRSAPRQAGEAWSATSQLRTGNAGWPSPLGVGIPVLSARQSSQERWPVRGTFPPLLGDNRRLRRIRRSDRAAKGTARASAAVPLRSRVPRTAGNRREQPPASLSIYAGFPAVPGCARSTNVSGSKVRVGFPMRFSGPLRSFCGPNSAVHTTGCVPLNRRVLWRCCAILHELQTSLSEGSRYL